jgi:TusA-related sulfurtransferase
MTDASPHFPPADAVCDGGDLDCGSGLLLIIRQAMEPLPAGGVLEVRSREISVKEDLPAWCRMVGHALLGVRAEAPPQAAYYIRKKTADDALKKDLEEARRFTWKVRARTAGPMSAKVFARNHSFVAGQPASFDTADAAPSAIEYLLGSLAGALLAGFEWRASRRAVALANVEISVQARCDNVLVFLGLEDGGHAGLAAIEGRLFVESDAEQGVLEELWRETLARCPIAQTLARRTPLSIELRIA